jgi:hypothetical protein
MWIDPPGYFCRESGLPRVKFAFTNYAVAIGLQAAGVDPDRVNRVNDFFWQDKFDGPYADQAISQIMGCCAVLPGALLAPQPERTAALPEVAPVALAQRAEGELR